jgi:hypothetical protein
MVLAMRLLPVPELDLDDGIPEGWDPDPFGRHQLRYWDGQQWTDAVEDFGVLGSDPVPIMTVDDDTDSGASEACVPADPALVTALADSVESLVSRLRDIARRDRVVGADVELSALAIEAVRRARALRGAVPDARAPST